MHDQDSPDKEIQRSGWLKSNVEGVDVGGSSAQESKAEQRAAATAGVRKAPFWMIGLTMVLVQLSPWGALASRLHFPWATNGSVQTSTVVGRATAETCSFTVLPQLPSSDPRDAASSYVTFVFDGPGAQATCTDLLARGESAAAAVAGGALPMSKYQNSVESIAELANLSAMYPAPESTKTAPVACQMWSQKHPGLQLTVRILDPGRLNNGQTIPRMTTHPGCAIFAADRNW